MSGLTCGCNIDYEGQRCALHAAAQPAYRQSVGSLCSGYEGLGMGLALGLGHNVEHAWFVENDPAPSKILARHYPDVANYGDLKTLDFAAMPRVDILTAGYPCQPFSDAGLRKGADDPRHLWPYVADAVGALRPRVVFLENVRGHVRRGLDCVLADLAALGYDSRWGLVRASDAGAPHRRERIFVVAQDTDGAARGERWLAAPGQAPRGWARSDVGGRGGASASNATGSSVPNEPFCGNRAALPLGTEPGTGVGAGAWRDAEGDHLTERGAHVMAAPADARSERRERRPDLEGAGRDTSERSEASRDTGDSDSARLDAWGVYEPAIRRWEAVLGRAAPWATEPRGRGGAERLSPRFVEWMMGLPAGWVTDCDLSANEQLKSLGNGVVPQQAALAVAVLRHNSMNVEAAA